MKFVRSIMFAALAVCLLTNCADDPAEDFLWSNWLATSVVRHDCDIATDNGPLNCLSTLPSCVSCLKLNLKQDGSYILKNALNGSTITEIGTYKTKSGAIELNPLSGDAYDLPITDSTPTILVIEFPGNAGCIATISMEATDCI